MKNSKKIVFRLPEIYLLLAVVYCWILTANLLNPFAIVLIGLLVFQLYTRNKVTGISIASILIILSFFMLFALMSELNEFPVFNSNAKLLAVVGFSFFGINIIAGSIMLVLYLSDKINAPKLNYK
jgi:hypothetical protein